MPNHNWRDRSRRPARRQPFLDPKPTILVVCEGRVTEPEYFRALKTASRNPRVFVELVEGQGVPLSVVRAAKTLKDQASKRARRERDDNLAYDSVWCVYDMDDHPHHHEAREMAGANSINLAISNPCFELWLLLHFRDDPGAVDRVRLRAMLKERDPDYDKHITHPDYLHAYETASLRAKRMDEGACSRGDSGCNPSTTVYKLTREIKPVVQELP
jgi:hypothetical protein